MDQSDIRQKEIRWVSFPYSNMDEKKHRPALIVSNNSYNQGPDILACAITSNLDPKPYSIYLEEKEILKGQLPLKGRVRADKIISIEKTLFGPKIAQISDKLFLQVRRQIDLLIPP